MFSHQNSDKLDSGIEEMLRRAAVPGAALAVASRDGPLLSRGYGSRDVDNGLPMTQHTTYPIGSTTKSINATLLGTLVDEGKLSWDEPVRSYLPRFRLCDPRLDDLVTVRDLIVMRTGLPRHDFVWLGSSAARGDLLERLAHLPLSCAFRERFQYNNLTVTLAGHIVEVMTEQSWEQAVLERVLAPLGMKSTGFLSQSSDTKSYHQTASRQLVETYRRSAALVAPAGGSLWSTVNDMTHWLMFNLNHGATTSGRRLLREKTLAEIQSPVLPIGADPVAPSAEAMYGLGWFIDAHRARRRISHTGFIHDVSSCVTLLPEEGIAAVSFVNFGATRLANLINQFALEVLMGDEAERTLEGRLRQYEEDLEVNRRRTTSAHRAPGTTPTHELRQYVGTYLNPGYGTLDISSDRRSLFIRYGDFDLRLDHWHYDSWVAAENDLFEIHKPHAFDRSSQFTFVTNANHGVTAVLIQFEPATVPIRFERQ